MTYHRMAHQPECHRSQTTDKMDSSLRTTHPFHRSDNTDNNYPSLRQIIHRCRWSHTTDKNYPSLRQIIHRCRRSHTTDKNYPSLRQINHTCHKSIMMGQDANHIPILNTHRNQPTLTYLRAQREHLCQYPIDVRSFQTLTNQLEPREKRYLEVLSIASFCHIG